MTSFQNKTFKCPSKIKIRSVTINYSSIKLKHPQKYHSISLTFSISSCCFYVFLYHFYYYFVLMKWNETHIFHVASSMSSYCSRSDKKNFFLFFLLKRLVFMEFHIFFISVYNVLCARDQFFILPFRVAFNSGSQHCCKEFDID